MPYRAVQSASQSVKKIYQMYKREGGGAKGVLNNVKKDCVICKSGHPLLYMKEMKSLK